jgi:hypothetical protein
VLDGVREAPVTPMRGHPSPDLPREQHATVELQGFDFYLPTPYGPASDIFGWSIDRCKVTRTSVDLLPGTHVVRLRQLSAVRPETDRPSREDITIRFRVQAGHTYWVRMGATNWPVWIEHADTGEVVGGVDPSGLEPVDPVPDGWEPTPPLWCDLTGSPLSPEEYSRRYPVGAYRDAIERAARLSAQPRYLMWFLSNRGDAEMPDASFHWWWHADVAPAGPWDQPRNAPPDVGAHEISVHDLIDESCENADFVVIEPVNPAAVGTRGQRLAWAGAYPAAAVDFDRHRVSAEAFKVPWDEESWWPFDEETPWPLTYVRPCRVGVAYGVAPDSDGSVFEIRIVSRKTTRRVLLQAPEPVEAEGLP